LSAQLEHRPKNAPEMTIFNECQKTGRTMHVLRGVLTRCSASSKTGALRRSRSARGLARGEGFLQPGELTVQQQAGLVSGFWFGLGKRSGRRNRGRPQLSEAPVAGRSPATTGTEKAALWDGLVEEDGHGWFLFA
jgi:hypothetical protein